MTEVTLETFVADRRIGRVHITIGLVCLLAQFVDGFDFRSLSLVAPVLAKHWHIARGGFGPVFSATAAGVLVGGLLAGPLSDRLGRKPVLFVSLLVAAALMAATVWTKSLNLLIGLRLACGLALGAIVPITIVLANEWAPRRHRMAMVLTMCAGYSLGAALSPLIVAALLAAFGWRSVFYAGAGGSVLMALLVVSVLPESLLFLRKRGSETGRLAIARTVARVSPEITLADNAAAPQRGGLGDVFELFRHHRGAITALLWASLFLTMIAETFLTSWLPTLLGEHTSSTAQALSLTALLAWGGIAAVLLGGVIADRVGPWRLLIGLYACGALLMALVGLVIGTTSAVIVTLFATGFCVLGAHHLITALSATFYPTVARATGTGWAVAVGRLGSIVGPLIGGALIDAQWRPALMFPAMAAFVAAAGVLVVLLAWSAARRSEGGAPP